MRKIIVIICLAFFALNFLALNSALANSNFATDYEVTYYIKEDGKTSVIFDIVLTNKTTQYYASSYNIQVGFEDIENAKASDPDGAITPVIIKKNNETTIEIYFNSRVVGIDNKLNFNLSFDTKGVAKKVGKIWEVNIPGLSNQDSFQSFNVFVKTPSSFGKPSYIKPEIAQSSKNSLNFTKDQLGSSGIYIGFGDFQIYKFNLNYHLKNPHLFKTKTEIAIPPSTNYQDIEIEDISPNPENVFVDSDGNWLAEYLLIASQKIDVVVKGKAKIYLHPKKEQLTKEKVDLYLKEQPYWESLNLDIKNLARKLKTPRAIYDYTVENLSYDITRVLDRKQRLGSVSILKNPKSAVCLEFTDLFIALSRAVGIPAREVDGFAYTQNSKDRPLSLLKDVLHAWPEYYDFEKQAWIMVDPTWGNTTKGLDYFQTLDFDHLAFVIKGVSSEYPIPAGGYKFEGQESLKDVDVSFGDTFDDGNSNFTIDWNVNESYASGLPIQGEIIIKNIGSTMLPTQIATITSNFLKPSPQQFSIKSIPPFGFSTFKFTFGKTPVLTNRAEIVTIALADRLSSQSLKIYPIFLYNAFLLGGGIFIATIIVILSFVAIKTRHIFIPKQGGTSFIRWKSKKS